jgi:SAM-dependent methyltransferase
MNTHVGEALAQQYPVRLVCPVCRGALRFDAAGIACSRCAEEFVYRNGFPDLIVGGRFDDDDDVERSTYEEQSNAWLAREYLVPHLRRLLAGTAHARVLSLGCGTGTDIDLLTRAGIDVVGIDCGNRTAVWPRREQKHRFYLANGKHLPFDAHSFDAVYCGCVFPHVGVEGDSTRVRPDYWEERLAIAREITRVLRPGGHVMVSSPNRLFPLDLFHGRSPDQPYPRVNPPWSRFLLSASDYGTLFAQAGCACTSLLPVDRYWGFIRAKRTLKGRVLAFPIETLFRIVSFDTLKSLRGSPLNPWLVLVSRKPHAA